MRSKDFYYYKVYMSLDSYFDTSERSCPSASPVSLCSVGGRISGDRREQWNGRSSGQCLLFILHRLSVILCLRFSSSPPQNPSSSSSRLDHEPANEASYSVPRRITSHLGTKVRDLELLLSAVSQQCSQMSDQ